MEPARQVSTEKPQQMHELFRLRHQVFVEELGFFDHAQQEIETDAHDESAVHIGQWIDGQAQATVRLVLRRPLPCEAWCTFTGGESFFQGMRVGEVSRICLSRPLREGSGLQAQTRQCLLHLFEGIAQAATQRRLTHIIAAMERPFVQRLQRMGLDFRPVGPEVDYFGPVQPWALATDQGLAAIPRLATILRARGAGATAQTTVGVHP